MQINKLNYFYLIITIIRVRLVKDDTKFDLYKSNSSFDIKLLESCKLV